MQHPNELLPKLWCENERIEIMIIQIGTEVDESRILWKYKESDEWKRADIDDLIRAYEDGERTGEWIKNDDFTCSACGYHMIVGGGAYNYCPNCGAKMKGGKE